MLRHILSRTKSDQEVIVHRRQADFSVQNEGSIFLLIPHTDSGNAWIEEHISEDARRFGGGVVVEHRYILDIVNGSKNDGLEVR
jgi:hypothetical protein